MTMRFKDVTGSDISLSPDNLTVNRRFLAVDSPPVSPSGDYFDYVASEAIAWVRSSVPTYGTPYGTLYWNSIKIHENHYALNYSISVTYTNFDNSNENNQQTNPAGAYQISIDQTGGTQNVTAGTVIGAFGDDAPAALADVPPSIGVQGETVAGIDIPIEQTRINVRFRHPQEFLTTAYIREIGRLVGYPNEDGFLGYDPGEVLFLGGSFSESNTESSAEYGFAISYNRTAFEVAGITIDNKKGWDVLDPVYKEEVKDDRAVRTIDYFKTIRPADRQWVDYRTVFGWGGT